MKRHQRLWRPGAIGLVETYASRTDARIAFPVETVVTAVADTKGES
jgi:hypothetical protein